MFTKRYITLLFSLAILLSACTVQPTILPTVLPTIVIPTATTPPTAVPATETIQPPTETPAPTSTTLPSINSLPDYSASTYLDDRSTAAALMLSYFNAINRQEYLRAYSYYTNNANIGTLEQFSSGYNDTQAVSVVFDNISSDGAAGSIYFTVPMILNATTVTNTQQKFAACYILRLPQPGNYSSPPVTPLHIERGTAKSVPLDITNADALSSACPSPDFPTGMYSASATFEQLSDLGANNYIDNRSDPAALMSSYVNAINRKEFARALTYWQSAPETSDGFAARYGSTASVAAQFGTPLVDVYESQTISSLPVVFVSNMPDGSTNTYAGCYVMQLTQPAAQTTGPFQPLAITSATVNQVDNSSDVPTLLEIACP